FVVESETGRRLLDLDGACDYKETTPEGSLIFNRKRPGRQQALEIWSVKGTPRVRRFPGLRAWTRSADGRLLLVGDEAKSRGAPGRAPAAVMDTDSGAIRPLWREGVEGKQQLTVDGVSLASSFSPDGRLLALFPAEAATQLGFWDVTT